MALALEKMNTKEKIVRAAAELLARDGRDAVSTRAVAAAAGVQAPTLYRHFSDMRELLDAVASYGFATYLREKTSRERLDDPVEELRRGWNLHVAFGLRHPGFYTLMYGDPRPGAESKAASEGFAVLHALVQRIAEAGRLRVGVERAAQMIHAAASGVTFALLELKPEDRDLELSALTREAVLAAVTLPVEEDSGVTNASSAQSRVVRHAVALKALLPEVATLSVGERALLAEWLAKLGRP